MRPANFRPPRTGGHSMRAVLDIVLLVLQIYIWLLIAAAVLSWLVAFNVVNTRNQVVAMLLDFLYRLTEPLLRPIRSMLPNLVGIDLSPAILILLLFVAKKRDGSVHLSDCFLANDRERGAPFFGKDLPQATIKWPRRDPGRRH